ncbi:hypothetical protein HPB50_004284 [Hyalomma asiaticum]|uniref:Uncharacterized protein n=1 Tax=Hyalomma asiaticum TaxID=266040 RepID=A0ACB7T893_HYAAI|nr:hypothetical protein HPB50_004284 [Hyalomma asiaticum]
MSHLLDGFNVQDGVVGRSLCVCQKVPTEGADNSKRVFYCGTIIHLVLAYTVSDGMLCVKIAVQVCAAMDLRHPTECAETTTFFNTVLRGGLRRVSILKG